MNAFPHTPQPVPFGVTLNTSETPERHDPWHCCPAAESLGTQDPNQQVSICQSVLPTRHRPQFLWKCVLLPLFERDGLNVCAKSKDHKKKKNLSRNCLNSHKPQLPRPQRCLLDFPFEITPGAATGVQSQPPPSSETIPTIC